MTREDQASILRLDFDSRVMLQFRGSLMTSEAGLLANRELGDVVGLSPAASELLVDVRTGKNGRQAPWACSVNPYSADLRDMNGALHLRRDRAIRWIIDVKAAKGLGASPSQMGRFETNWLARPENIATVSYLPGHWIDQIAKRHSRKGVALDMDSSISPMHGDQESSMWERALRLHLLPSALRV